MTQTTLIDAIIISHNESSRVERCINALRFVNKIIVVDNNSIDDTRIIAKRLNASIIESSMHDFSSLRNIGAATSKAQWLLYIDADEVVTSKLKEEIRHVIENINTHIVAYVLPRKNYYMGQLWPVHDGMIRLIKKSAFIKWEGALHEHALVDGTVSSLENFLIHDTHRSLEEMVSKTNQWSNVEAKLRFDAKHPHIKPWRIFRVMMTEFSKSFIGEQGWSVGTIGWIESMYQAFSIFITYSKLWEMQRSVVSNQS